MIDLRKTKTCLLPASLVAASLALTVARGASDDLPDVAELDEEAPAEYTVRIQTTRGEFEIAVHREWAPIGADRFYNLVRHGFYDDSRFFRVEPGFVVQFGLSGDPQVGAVWNDARIKDDPVRESNKRGTVSFAARGPNTRTTQVFVNLRDNSVLDGRGFSPFGEVVSGMEVLTGLFSGYGERMNQQMIQRKGNAWLDEHYPELDKLTKATLGPAHTPE